MFLGQSALINLMDTLGNYESQVLQIAWHKINWAQSIWQQLNLTKG